MNDDERSIESRLGALGDALNDALDRRPLEPAGGGRRAPRSPRRLLAVAAAALVVAGGAGVWAISTGSDDGSGATGSQGESTPPPTTVPGLVATPPPTVPTSTDPAGGPVTTPPPTASATEVTPTPPPTTGTQRGPSLLAVGDLVMAGARVDLESLGFVVEAEESAQASTMVSSVAALVDGLDPTVAVIQIGNNGTISASDAEALMDAVSDVSRVVVLTVVGDKPWVAPNNELIATLPARYPNVAVLAWDAVVPACPGDCFATDGLHLTSDGAHYYAGLIALVAGVEAQPAPSLPPTTVPSEVSTTMVVGSGGTPPPTTVPAATCADGSQRATYTLVAGDSPARVAVKLDVALDDLAAANAGNPEWDQWVPGSVIYLPCRAIDPSECPDGSTRASYTIAVGDSPSVVAEKLDLAIAELELANGDNPAWDAFMVGQEIHLPCP